MVKQLRFLLTLLLFMAVSFVWADKVKYTVSSTKAVTVSGTAPNGSSAEYSSTYGTQYQLTKGNSMTLTLKGFDGCTITNLTLSMKSNSSGGQGYLYYAIDNNQENIVGSSIGGVGFNQTAWNGSWSTSYVDISKTVNIACTSSDLKIVLGATANSIYCQSFEITYSKGDTPVTKPTVSLGTLTNITEVKLYDGNLDDLTDGAEVAAGTTVYVEPVAEEGYEVKSIVVTAADGSELPLTENRENWSFTMPESNVTINVTAEKSEEEPAGDEYFVKVKDTNDVTEGDYLIVYEGGNLAFNGGLSTLDAVSNTISVTITNEKIAKTSATSAAIFTIDTNGHIKSASGNYIGKTDDANGLSSSDKTQYTNTITIDDDANANIVSQGGAYLRYNNASNQNRFRYYKSTSYTGQKAIQLYKFEDKNAKKNPQLAFSEQSFSIDVDDVDSFIAPTLTTAPDFDGTITYSSSDENLAIVDETTGEIVLDKKAGSVTITATSQETENFKAGTASYTINIIQTYNIAGFKALADNTVAKLKLTNAQVLYASGKDTYVRDDSGAIDFYDTGLGFTTNQILNGTLIGKKATYKGLPEVATPISENNVVATEGTEAEPWPADVSDVTLEEFVSDLVEVSGTVVTEDGNNYYVSDGTNKVAIYNKFKLNDVSLTEELNGREVTVTGIVVPYNNAPQIAITKFVLAPEYVTVEISEKAKGVGFYGSKEYYYGTMYYSDKRIKLNNDNGSIEALVLRVSDGKLESHSSYSGYNNDVIAEGVGVLLQADAAGTYKFEVTTDEPTVKAIDGNLLQGTDDDATITDAGYKYYMLSLDKNNDNLGFYFDKNSNGGTQLKNKAHKAYLAVPTEDASAKGYAFGGDETTGVEGIENGELRIENSEVYDLQGRRMNGKNLPKGVYIVNGKKVVK